ncbi:MAG: transporter permease [Thermoproteota archaeon]|nr:transporter permease [Thermoproteota archaeon]
MNLLETFTLAFEALKERRLRSTLTILMVIMGASLIVALDGTGNGFTAFIDNQFSTLGSNIIIIQPRSSSFKMDTTTIDAISDIEGVSEVIPFIQQISSVSSGSEDQSVVIVGVDQSKLPILFPTISLQSGDYVASSDSIGILLGSEVTHSDSASGPFATIGQTIMMKYQRYEGQKPIVSQLAFSVRGTLNTIGSSIVPVDQMVFISLSSANNFFDRGSVYDGVYMITGSSDTNSAVQNRIRNRYSSDITITSPQAIANVIDNIKGGVYLFISIVAYVSLLVASVGIITTLHTSMMERTKEIGLLKAIGFSNTLVLTLFLNEATIIGIIGGFIGLGSGIGLSFLMSNFVGGSFRIGGEGVQIIPWFSPTTLFTTWLLCVGLSMISGFYPAWRASRLDPVVALRQE